MSNWVEQRVEKLEKAVEAVTKCDLDEETKVFVLSTLKESLESYKAEAKRIQANLDFVKNGFSSKK